MSNTKFGRNYQLSIQLPSLLPGVELPGAASLPTSTLIIKPPLTIEFDITRHSLASANTCQVRIYNLSRDSASQIYFNSFNNQDFRIIQLQAGYGTNLSTIFTGNITQAWSVREGVNFITQIECYDGGWSLVNANINLSFVAGTPYQVIIETIMNSIPNVGFGACSVFLGATSKGETYSGNPKDILTQLTGGAFYIDKGKAYCITSGQYVQYTDSLFIEINSSTGLLNTPILEQSMLRFELLFSPELNVNDLINLTSTTEPILNGHYIVTSVKHRGIISQAVCGSLITEVELLIPKSAVPVVAA